MNAMGEDVGAGYVVGGRYRLQSKLGAGGFGRVWLAFDEELSVEVAIKQVWLPESASRSEQEERLRRAQREARNTARLRDNPHVVTVYDVLIDGGAPWTVMQFVRGSSLQDHLDTHGPLAPALAAKVAAGMLSALGAAHAAGITHRDVKPANVLLSSDGGVLLTDFGIAVAQSDTALTSTGAFIGSVEYVAPERARLDEAGPAADLFSLGATLYQALTGVSPFRRESQVAALTAVLFEEPKPLGGVGPLADLVMALLRKDPDSRPTVAQAEAALAGGGLPAVAGAGLAGAGAAPTVAAQVGQPVYGVATESAFPAANGMPSPYGSTPMAVPVPTSASGSRDSSGTGGFRIRNLLPAALLVGSLFAPVFTVRVDSCDQSAGPATVVEAAGSTRVALLARVSNVRAAACDIVHHDARWGDLLSGDKRLISYAVLICLIIVIALNLSLRARTGVGLRRFGALAALLLLPVLTVDFSVQILGQDLSGADRSGTLYPNFGTALLWLAALMASIQFVTSVVRVGRGRLRRR